MQDYIIPPAARLLLEAQPQPAMTFILLIFRAETVSTNEMNRVVALFGLELFNKSLQFVEHRRTAHSNTQPHRTMS